MGKQAKIKRIRRIRKEMEEIIQEGVQTGKIIEEPDGNIKFKDEKLAE